MDKVICQDGVILRLMVQHFETINRGQEGVYFRDSVTPLYLPKRRT